jgi:Cof subfamily protein (haloacid dehalogenase superfamily)
VDLRFAGRFSRDVRMQDIQLVALDIDGTLIPPRAGHEAVPDAEITDAIARLVEAGIAVVLASGRMYPGTLRMARHLGLDGPLICQQGASVHRLDGSLLHRFAIDADIADQLVAFALEHDWPYAWFDAARYLVSRPNDASVEYGLVSGVTPEYRVDAHRAGVVPTGIDIISTVEHANGVHQVLEARYGDRITLLDFPSVTAAHAREASKGNALAILAQDLGIEQHAVLAVGDSVNDASMLRWAGRGVAMPHSDRYAREAADEILEGAGVSGLAPLLRSVLG